MEYAQNGGEDAPENASLITANLALIQGSGQPHPLNPLQGFVVSSAERRILQGEPPLLAGDGEIIKKRGFAPLRHPRSFVIKLHNRTDISQ
jgi:hypothetical protein